MNGVDLYYANDYSYRIWFVSLWIDNFDFNSQDGYSCQFQLESRLYRRKSMY
ncbi:MAG: hypothetical protein ACI9RU_000483 [Litorivivens sp.]|jgi:hypothetical protein